MTALQRRLFIAIDEWFGIVLLLYLHKIENKLFQPAFIAWAIMVYGVSYPFHWYYQYKERKLLNVAHDRAMRNLKL